MKFFKSTKTLNVYAMQTFVFEMFWIFSLFGLGNFIIGIVFAGGFDAGSRIFFYLSSIVTFIFFLIYLYSSVMSFVVFWKEQRDYSSTRRIISLLGIVGSQLPIVYLLVYSIFYR